MSGDRDRGRRPAAPPHRTSGPLFDTALGHHREGRLAEAERLYLAVVAVDRHHVGALHNLGLIRSQQGRHEDAVALLRRAIAGDPSSAGAHSNLGTVLQAMGRHGDALASYAQALALAPGFAMAHNNYGNALLALNRPGDAAAALGKALALAPDLVPAHNNLGNALLALGRPEAAVASYERALALAADDPEAHNNLGNALASLGRHRAAIAHYERALAAAPRHAEAHYNLGNALLALGRPADALRPYRQAIALRPRYAEAHNNLGNALQALDRHVEAVDCYAAALASRPDLMTAYNNVGNSLQALDRHVEAVARYRQALALRPDSAEAHNNLGEALKGLGRIAEAASAFEAAAALAPRTPAIYLNLGDTRIFRPGDPHLAALEALAQDAASLPRRERAELDFALAKALADVGETARSFHHLAQGNRLVRREVDYDEAATLALFDRVRTVFTGELLRRPGEDRGDPSPEPLFIFGMPRSGTTLVEQILASHRAVHGAGEIAYFSDAVAGLGEAGGGGAGFPEIIAASPAPRLRRLAQGYVAGLRALAPGARRISDKMPTNFLYAGLIHLLLPNARLIHVGRDPVDTCFSCFSRLFARGHPHTYDLGELGRYYRAYATLMAHWRAVLPQGVMLELRYEEIVADLEGEARRIVAHCGLDWDPACLAPHRTERPVRTASAAQVRQPLYATSVGRSLPYREWLGPLIAALGGEAGAPPLPARS